MNESKIIVRYARAAFELARENGLLEELRADMHLIMQVMNENPELRKVLENPVIPPSGKRSVFREIFRTKVQEMTLRFIDMILLNNRETFIPDIARRFFTLYRGEAGITEVRLTTAAELEDEVREKIESLLAGKYGKVDITAAVNPSIIGGFILRVDDRMLDASVLSQLKKLRKDLIKGTTTLKKTMY